MGSNFQSFVEQTLTTRLGHGQQNVITVTGDGNIVIQDVVTDRIIITQNISGIDEATIMKEVVAKIVARFPLAPNNTPKELNTIQMATPRKIIGRTYEVQHIMERLNKDNSLLLVSGIGGIGKTVTANYYYTLFHDLYQHILWLQGGQDLETALLFDAGLHESLGLSEKLRPLMPYDRSENKSYALAILEKALKNLSPRTLFLIDNASETDFRTIQKWQSTFKQFHFLITSRAQNTNLNTYTLGVLPREDALALFYTHYTFEQDDAIATQILEQLHDHTLLIELVAKAGQEGAIPLQKLLEFLQTGYIQHEGLQYKIDINEVLPDRIPEEERIINYIRLLFNTILKLDDDEQQILLSLAALPKTPHDRDILLKILEGTPKKKDQPPLTPNETIDILNVLFGKGYLQRHGEQKKHHYSLHPLIGAATRENIPPTVEKLERVIDNVAGLLSIDQTKDNPVNKFPFIPFGEAVLALFTEASDEEIGRLQNELAIVLQALGDYYGAKALLEKALHSDEKKYGKNHPNTAISYSNLATALQALGDYAGAKVLLEKALHSDELNFGENHPNTAVRYSNLALVLQDLGDYTGAKVLLEKALHSDEVNFGENHPATARSYSNLATVLQDLRDYAGAERYLKKSLAVFTKELGENHPNVAVLSSNLAAVLQDLGDYLGAKKLFEKALYIDEVNFGKNHPATAVSYSNLALVLKYFGDYAGAKVLLEKTMKSMEGNFGEDHPNTSYSYSNLATVLQSLGDYEKAFTLSSKAYRSYANQLGEQHPNTKIIKGVENGIVAEMLQNGWTAEQIEKLKNT